MAKYTATLQDLAMMNIWEKNITLPDTSIDTLISTYAPMLFDFSYPFPQPDPSYSKWLNQTKEEFQEEFVRHFWLREIGFETENIFKYQLQSWLTINYDKYNLLYNDFLATYQIRIHQDLNTVESEDKTGNETSNTNASSSVTGNNRTTTNQQSNSLYSDEADTRINISNAPGTQVPFASDLSQDNYTSTVNMTTSNQSNTQSEQTKANADSRAREISVTGLGLNDDNEQYREFQEYYQGFYEIIFNDLRKLFLTIY